MTSALAALERQVARELEILAYPAANWVVPGRAPDGSTPLDCAIIGAGMFGLATGGLLMRERVTNIALFDAAPEGREGPWVTFARMAMLRTPKELSGPELGIPSLSFRAWWEAQHGAESWNAMFRIPRTAWMDYLGWFRRVMALPVSNGWRLVSLETVSDTLFRLGFETAEGPRTRHARTIALTTGGMGGGGYAIPDGIRRAVPADRVVHAMDVFDPAIFRGSRLGILGAGASAFDLAIAALDAGAARAEVAVRRAELPRDNPRRWMENAGYLQNYVDLPDAQKWKVTAHLRDIGQPPPQPTFDACLDRAGFVLRTGFPWDSVRWTGEEIVVEGGGQRAIYDHLAIATGFVADLSLRPEFARIVRHAARWRDRFTPPPGADNARMAAALYLDRFCALTEREPGTAPWLSRIVTMIGAANLTQGPVASSVSTMKYVTPRLVEGIKRALFLDQQDADWTTLLTGDHAELRPFTLPEANMPEKAA
ncbi:FAD/NAD(P)-binding protein [Falsiroseomonas sp. HW251]|uniref:FAD/NAD(P)-binding protein n=1 Tax=Falsiroseomonas sp. HW251 TaxID=3390998 RepID=UPI003D316FB3